MAPLNWYLTFKFVFDKDKQRNYLREIPHNEESFEREIVCE